MARAINWESQIGRRLRLRDLHVFLTVVQSGSMAKAAAHLKITQPSVSKAIGDLEAALGVRLFDRSTKGVGPTMYGDALIRCGSVVFDELRQGIRHIEFLADPTVGVLKMDFILPSVMSSSRAVHRKIPGVVLCVLSPAMGTGLATANDLNLAFTMQRRPADGGFESQIFSIDPHVLVAGATRGRRRRIDIGRCAGADHPGTPIVGLSSLPAFNRGLEMPGNLTRCRAPSLQFA
jgi:DNA-binding transcriptional LysR family regulator